MATYRVRYGGKKGTAVAFALSKDQLVVRTKAGQSMSRAALSPPALRKLDEMETVTEFSEAGVTVLRGRGAPQVAAKARNAARTTLKKDPDVRFAGRALVDQETQEPVVYTENFFIKFDDECKPAKAKKILKDYGLKIKRPLAYAPGAYFIEAPEGTGLDVFKLAENLLQLPEVELCHPELVRPTRKRSAYSQQWHLKRTSIGGKTIDEHAHVEDAWQLSDGDGIVIAIVDDGVDVGHPEFAGSWKIVAPRDVTRGIDSAQPGSNQHHGTACAGVACANGTAGASGVAPRAKLMPIRLASGLGSQAEADAFLWAVTHGADVISCSWGPPDGRWWDPSDPIHDRVAPLPDSTRLAIDHAIEHGRNGKGCVILWAAGNGNESADNDGYAAYEKVIAVGACNDQGKRSAYSDTGKVIWCCFPSSHGHASLTPGIWTTDRLGAAGYNPGDPNRGDREGAYTNSFGGTSSACPGAAGVAALVLSKNPDLRWHDVRNVLKLCCDKIDESGGGYDAEGRSLNYGYGRLNARRAVELALPPSPQYRLVHTAFQDVPILDKQTSTLSLRLAEDRPIGSIVVTVDIEHSYRGDLIVKLLAPPELGVPPLLLHDGEGGAEPNLKATFNEAHVPGLNQLNGRSARGVWELSVHDRWENDTGMIRSFSLDLGYE